MLQTDERTDRRTDGPTDGVDPLPDLLSLKRRWKNDNYLFFSFFFLGGGERYICLCISPYNSNFRYFETKSLLSMTSNLQVSTVYILDLCTIIVYQAFFMFRIYFAQGHDLRLVTPGC